MSSLQNLCWLYLNLICSVLVLTIVFYVLERLAPAEDQTITKRLFNWSYYPLFLAWVLALQVILAPAYSYFLRVSGGGLLSKIFSPPRGFVAQLLFALLFAVVWDLWQYWIHRWQHAWPLLWETHKFHHSETALNSSAQARHHFLNAILFAVLYVPLLILFGWLTPHFVASFVMFRVWGFVNHANLRLQFGSLTPLISSPPWHRIHHSVFAQHHNKNFAAFFPFIDLLFGTYYRPLKGEYPPTGLSPEQYSGNLREATVAPFAGLYQLALGRAHGLQNPVGKGIE